MFVFAKQKHYSSEDETNYEYFVETSLDLELKTFTYVVHTRLKLSLIIIHRTD